MGQQVFLSYAHGDNETPTREEVGWVSYFDRTVQIELQARGLTQVKLWRDARNLDYLETLDGSLKSEAQDSDMLVAVLSPLYIQRPFCLHELKEFVARNGADWVLIVAKRPVDKEPDEIRGRPYVPFFALDPETKRVIPFYEGFGKKISPEYYATVGMVADVIEAALKRVAEKGTPETGTAEKGMAAQPAPAVAPATAEPAAPTGATVFLAGTSGDRRDDWLQIRNELRSMSCRVLPEAELPTTGCRAVIEQALAEADLSVHIVGATLGFTPEDLDTPIVPLQLELARAAPKKPRRLIWLPPDLTAPNAAQQKFVDGLKREGVLQPGDDLVVRPRQVFLDVVRRAVPTGSAAASPRPAKLYLLYDASDARHPALFALSAALRKAGHQVVAADWGKDGVDRNRSLLAGCTGAIVFWADAEAAAIAAQCEALAGTAAMRARAFFLPDATPGKMLFGSPEIDLTIAATGDLAADLAPFLDRLRGRDAG